MTERTSDWRIEPWSVDRALAEASAAWQVYQAVFNDYESEESWRELTYDKHCERPGFRLVAALVGPELVGFSYGYIGERGQYWTDRVAEALPPDVAEEWVGHHFDFVELGVLEQFRGQGIGSALHDALMTDLEVPRALLGTDAAESPAVRLYRSRGWIHLGLLEPGVQVMGWRR